MSAMAVELKPRCLLVEELNYELRIRGVQTSRDVNDKRKMLGKLLDKERNRNVEIEDPNFIFDTERLAIDTTLENIKQIVREFEGPATDSTYVRVRARLAHVTARIRRMALTPEHGQEAITFKNEAYATCLILEAELDEHVTRDGTQTTNQLPGEGRVQHGNEPGPNVVHVHNAKPAAIYKWDVKFNGAMDAFAVKNFLERVDELAEARHVSKVQLFEAANDLFVGKGRLWLQQVKKEKSVTDWDSLVARLEKDFIGATYEDDLWQIIKGRGQRKDESVVIFIAVMQSLFSRLRSMPAESTRVKWILKNFRSEIRDKLLLQEFGTVAELATCAHRIEEALAEFSRSPTSQFQAKEKRPDCEAGPIYFKRASAVSRSGAACCNVSTQKHNGSRAEPGFSDWRHGSRKPAVTEDRRRYPQNERGTRNEDGSGDKRNNCWNCGKPNHSYRFCKQERRKFCFKCGRSNVTVANCEKCSGNAGGRRNN